MGILALTADERVAGVKFTKDALSVSLKDGRIISVPLAWYPRLLDASPAERKNWRVAGGGYTGVLGVGGHRYEPEIAYLADSTGPKAGFHAVWGRTVTRGTAEWCEGLLQAWHRDWEEVAKRVGSRWSHTPYASGDLENALCIYQDRTRTEGKCEGGGHTC